MDVTKFFLQIDRYVTLNYLEASWSVGTLARTAWTDYGVYEYPYATEYSTTAFGTNPSVLGLTAGATTFYQHEFGTDADGQALNCFVTSGDFDIQDGQQLLHIYLFVLHSHYNRTKLFHFFLS